MASSIDATKPTAGAALTADVRNNFSAAKTEIEALQAAVASALVAKAGDTMTGALNWAATQTIASAATTDIGAATSNVVIISGTTPITGLGTIAAGAERCVTFSGALTLTHNATSLILPGGANITTAAGDVAYFASLGAGNWRCTGYQKANGQSVVTSGGSPGGSSGQLQYNNAGAFAGDAGFTFDSSKKTVVIASSGYDATDRAHLTCSYGGVQSLVLRTLAANGQSELLLGSSRNISLMTDAGASYNDPVSHKFHSYGGTAPLLIKSTSSTSAAQGVLIMAGHSLVSGASRIAWFKHSGALNTGYVAFNSAFPVGWSSDGISSLTTAPDTAWQRGAAGRIDATDGASNLRDVRVRSLISSGGVITLSNYTVATLPTAASNTHAIVAVTDGNASPTYRGAVTGGGSTKGVVYCDGSSWMWH